MAHFERLAEFFGNILADALKTNLTKFAVIAIFGAYLWLFPPQLHVVYSWWTTVMVIELLLCLLSCCVVTELIVFSELRTQNT